MFLWFEVVVSKMLLESGLLLGLTVAGGLVCVGASSMCAIMKRQVTYKPTISKRDDQGHDKCAPIQS